VAKGLRATLKIIRERRPAAAPARLQERDAADPLLESLTRNAAAQVAEAQHARGADLDPIRQRSLAKGVQRLIDLPDQPRILWVDDNPAGNRLEAAALAKLQIEVVSTISTHDAVAALDSARLECEPFNLVISDWSRPTEGADAGLRLLRHMRKAHHDQPFIVYHAEVDPVRRRKRAERARAAGAIGETVLPHELMLMVQRALQH
jgi:CheY-like chemotaxis protein